MKRTIIYIIPALLLSACGADTTEQPVEETTSANTITLTDAQASTFEVSFAELTQHTMSTTLQLNGKVELQPQARLVISLPLGGTVSSVATNVGKAVQKGDLLATVQDPQYVQLQEDYLKLLQEKTFADADLQRQQQLKEGQALSEKAFQQKRMEYAKLGVSLKAVEEKLRMLGINPSTLSSGSISKDVRLVATMAGVVSAVNISTGQYAAPNDVLLELIDPKQSQLSLQVFEKDLGRLQVGQMLKAATNENSQNRWNCEVLFVKPDLAVDGTSEVLCKFADGRPSPAPGTYMNAEVVLADHAVSVVPNKAIVTMDGSPYVFVDESEPNTYTAIALELGGSDAEYSEVLNASNLQGKKVVVDGSYVLLMALKNTSDE